MLKAVCKLGLKKLYQRNCPSRLWIKVQIQRRQRLYQIRWLFHHLPRLRHRSTFLGA